MYLESQVKNDIIEIGRRLWLKGFVAANDGNITVRVGKNEIWATPTGVSKGFLKPEMLIKLDLDGNVISGTWKPTSELKMHLRVYKEREDVMAVLHAHPPVATSFAIVGKTLDAPIMPEAVISLGVVPIAEYGTPSTEELPENVSKYLQECDALLLENHGALTYGPDVYTAYYRMETMEFYAYISLLTHLLGGARELSEDKVRKLVEIRKKLGVKGRYPVQRLFKRYNINKEELKEEQLVDMVTRITKRVLEEIGQ